MKITYVYKYLMFALLAVILGACTKAESNKNDVEQFNSRQKELNDLLLSSAEGWKAVYYTDSTQLGGWTHLFKFLPEGKVDMTSDFDEDTVTRRSRYEIGDDGSTASLIFTTANRIQLLSDPGDTPNAQLKGKGYLGESEFFYQGQKNGEIIFKTKKVFQQLRFIKATAQDWTDLPKNTRIIKAMKGDGFTYKSLIINDGTTSQNYDFDYNPLARFAVASPSAAGSGNLNEALAFTSTGAVLNPAIVVKGQKLSNFIYDDASKTFTAAGTGGVSALIKFSNISPKLTDDYKILLPGEQEHVLGYFLDDAHGVYAPTNSPLFKDELAKINAKLPKNIQLTDINLVFNYAGFDTKVLTGAGKNFIMYQFFIDGNSKSLLLYHSVDVIEDATDKKIILKSKYWWNEDDAKNSVTPNGPSYLTSFDNYLVNDSGIYVKKENFKIYYSNPVYTISSPLGSFRMTVWLRG